MKTTFVGGVLTEWQDHSVFSADVPAETSRHTRRRRRASKN